MTEILFDGRKVVVEPGTNLVEAGLKAGVPVPVFCYHKELGAVGSCRVCACTVKGLDGKSRTVMACMTAAMEGMEVTTLDKASVELRKYVVEWLMVNHPHDCPICDEGGECQLQDVTIATGHSQRRVPTMKRTFENQYLGEFIHHEMNRCITCFRCSRFYQEYAGGDDFGATGSRDRVYFGRFEDGPLESPFSGNLVEMCPTGVFTDKLFHYKSRVWDLEIQHSVCPHCSVGCNVHPGSRHRDLQRVRVRENPAVNGPFLCDRGQFGHGYVMAVDRPLEVRSNGETTAWDQALGLAGADLLHVARTHGAACIALVTSSRASVETHAALQALAQGPLAGARIAHFDDPGREMRAIAALGSLAAAGCAPLDQSDIGQCDVLLVAGASLVDEAPLAALAARQVQRRGGQVFVLNAGETYLRDVAHVMPVHPAMLARELQAIASKLGGEASDATGLAARALGAAKRPGILLGSDLLDGPAFAAGTALAQAVKARGGAARFGYLFPGPNGVGAAAMSREPALGAILEDLAQGKLRAALLVECETGAWDAKATAALGSLDRLVVLDYLAGALHGAASVFLPTTPTYESEGTYVNRAGRLQAFARAKSPGLPVSQQINGTSFARQYRVAPVLGDVRMAWQVLEQLREQTIGKPESRDLSTVRSGLARTNPLWAPLKDIDAGADGTLLDLATVSNAAAQVPAFDTGAAGLAVFRLDRTLGSEVLSRRSVPMQKMSGAPSGLLSPADAKKFGVNGAIVLTIGGHAIEMTVHVHEGVPEGMLLVPRDIEWPASAHQGATGTVVAHAMA